MPTSLAANAAAPGHRPLWVETVPVDGGYAVRVIGQSVHDIDLRYRLEISGTGGNRVRQGGDVSLHASAAPRHVANIRMSGSEVSGRLLVQLESGASYEQPIQADRD